MSAASLPRRSTRAKVRASGGVEFPFPSPTVDPSTTLPPSAQGPTSVRLVPHV